MLYDKIIIHSKYVSISDWLKWHAQFIVTNYCRRNLKEFCDMWKMMSTVEHNCQKTEELAELEDLGRGWVVLVVSTKWRNILLVSRGRKRQTIGQKHSKNSNKTSCWTACATWRIFAVLNNSLSPKLANKQTIKGDLNIVACTAGAWKWQVQERTGRARETLEGKGSACPRGP